MTPGASVRTYGRMLPAAILLLCAILFAAQLNGQSSPWLTGSGGMIYYNGGSVGIGTSTVVGGLTVSAGLDHLLNVRGDPVSFGLPSGLTGPILQSVNSAQTAFTPMTFYTGGTNFLGGNVGVGTTSPGTKLSVVSSGSIDGLTLSSVNRSSIWFTTTGPYNSNWLLQNAVSSNTDFQFLASTTVGGTPTTSVMTLLASGNVGIGTTNPQHLLHVTGTIGAQEVIVSSTGADYVFEPGYRLAPLTEVAGYIQEHHHLPDIPPALDAQVKGVSVGEMQMKLLAKIEELTLHMIQEHERNDRLEQNRELQQRIREIRAQLGANASGAFRKKVRQPG